jgi:hypothetical protein
MMGVINVGKILVLAINFLFFGCKSESKSEIVQEKIDTVKLEMTFMAYACGDCVDLYRIDKVISSENNKSEFFLNKEIEVEFIDDNTNAFLEKTKCPWNCFKFTCEGKIIRKKNGMLHLKANKTKLIKISNCCTID